MYSVRSEKLRQGLNDLCKYIESFYATKTLTVLEIGSFAGESTEILAKHFKKVHAVDPWNQKMLHVSMQKFRAREAEHNFIERMKKFDNVIKINNTSMGYEKECNEIFDVVYIDGCHDYDFVLEDIIKWSKKCRLFMCGHDYLPLHPGVIKAVNEVYGKPDKTFIDNSWLVRLEECK